MATSAIDPVFEVRDAGTLQALSHPTRVQILEALREPMSASAVARAIGQPRQRVNHHVHELVEAGLVERVGEQRTGNFIATLYRSIARSFVVSPQVAWSDPRRMEAMRAQHSLESLVLLGERLQHDAVELLDRAAFDGEQIPSASVIAEACFASEEDRSSFMEAYLRAVAELTKQYASKDGRPYRVVLGVYPAGDKE